MSTESQDWLKKFSSHAKLATADFNTAAADKQAEYHRVLDELATKGKQNLKDMKTADDESNSALEQNRQGNTLGRYFAIPCPSIYFPTLPLYACYWSIVRCILLRCDMVCGLCVVM